MDVNEFCNNIDWVIQNMPQEGLVLTRNREEFLSGTNEDEILKAINASIEQKDYRLAKALNQYLAFLEVSNDEVMYKHMPVIIHAELSSFCNCECIMCTHCYEKNERAKNI